MAERRDKTEASATRKRALVSCDRCKLRRARCIRDNPDEPCADCKMSGVQCESKLPRKQRVYGSVETLSLRYRALESLVKGLFPQENVQDTNTLFKLAAARNIPMPANDDFTPADIFSNKDSQRPMPPQQQQQQQNITQHAPLLHHQSLPSRHTASGSARPDEADSSLSASKERIHSPFSVTPGPSRQVEELIHTWNSVPHYFGPSSSFRLATTIQTLVARYKAVPGTNFPPLEGKRPVIPGSAERISVLSVPQTITSHSDDEYTAPLSRGTQTSTRERRGSKRPRSRMEDTVTQWEDAESHVGSNTIGNFLPPRTLSDALVSAYFERIHIYFPLFHRGIFESKLESSYARSVESVNQYDDIGWLVCLALVFSFGCEQLHEQDPDEAHKLQVKYLTFTKTYFRELVATTGLTNIQALVLLSMHHHSIGQKSSCWLLTGLAARMAITMGMHRDKTNLEFDPLERNTRRQVWWSVYIFEKQLCNLLGRPTVIDEREMSMRIPDASMLEQKCMSVDFMRLIFELCRMSYTIRQRAYFDKATAEERSPTTDVAEALLRECDNFFATIPPHLSLDLSSVPPEQRARILLLHIYYYHMRCIVTRDFLIQKVERFISHLEKKSYPYSEDWGKILQLSEDCVDSAHKTVQCIMTISKLDLDLICYSFVDLFIVFQSILIVCADFLARPKEQHDAPKDTERKEMICAVLNHVQSIRKVAPTYSILREISLQFAGITGVTKEPITPNALLGQTHNTQSSASRLMPAAIGDLYMSDVQEDWFTSATKKLGLDFFDLNQGVSATVTTMPLNPETASYQGYATNTNEVEDWTARALKGNHAL